MVVQINLSLEEARDVLEELEVLRAEIVDQGPGPALEALRDALLTVLVPEGLA